MYKPREQNKISYAVSLTNSFEEINQAMYQSLNDVTSRLYDNIQKKVNTIGLVLKKAQDTIDKEYGSKTERLFSVINDYFQNVCLMGSHGSSHGRKHKAKNKGGWYTGPGSKIPTKRKKEKKKEQQARMKAEKKKKPIETSF